MCRKVAVIHKAPCEVNTLISTSQESTRENSYINEATHEESFKPRIKLDDLTILS